MFRISFPTPPHQRFRAWGYGIFGVAIALSFLHTVSSVEAIFNPQGLTLISKFLRAAIHPDLDPVFLGTVLAGTLTTFAYAVCGTFISLSLGFVGGLLCAEVLWQTIFPKKNVLIWQTMRAVLAMPRSIHEVVWGLLLINIWGLDPLVALGAIAIPFGAIVSKIFAEILDDTPRAGFAALIQAGVNPATAFLYGLLPQALFNLISYGFYRFECSLRSAAVLGIIGAGGLGYEIFLSLQSLRYEQLWTLFYALILLNGVVDWGSGFLREKLGCTSRLDLNTHQFKVGFQRRNWLFVTALGSLILVVWGFWYIQPDWTRLWSNRTLQFTQEVSQSLQRFSIDTAQLKTLFWFSLQTLEMSILAIAIAGVGGFCLAFLAVKQQSGMSQVRAAISRVVLLFCRGIPAPIWALVILFGMFPGILPGAIALGIHNLGILGRLMTEVIENVEPEPLDALTQLGSPPNLVFLYGTVPLTLPNFISYTFYRWEVCLRETVIVGFVGAGGLGRILTEQLSSFDYSGILATLICFLGLTYFVDSFSSLLRRQKSR
ncbi:MAG: ABC transporter permease subunit [Limnothrix sp.]